MKSKLAAVIFLFLFALAVPALTQEEKLGKVNFPNSCDAKVQAQFERGVAMLHSFWYSAAEKTFREVLTQDPSCAIATWGIAAILMSNPLAGAGSSPKGAAQAQAAIEQGRKSRRQDPARARLYRGGGELLRELGKSLRA